MIQHIHSELLAWGNWAARMQDAKGYPKASAFTRLTPPSLGWGTATNVWERVPDDLKRTDQAVQKLHPERTKIVIITLYKTGYRIRRTAGLLCLNPQTIINHRDKGHILLAKLLAAESEPA